ncbi:hypothetical protein D3C81_1756500 [compost metagenome]
MKTAMALGGAGVFNAESRQGCQHTAVVGAEGIGHASDGVAAQLFQLVAVVQQLGSDAFRWCQLQKRVGGGMGGNLMAGKQASDFLLCNITVSSEKAGIQMKGSFDAVTVHNFHQPAVMDTPVVIAKC